MNKFYDCFYNNDPSNKIRRSTDDKFQAFYNYKKPTGDLITSLMDTVYLVISQSKKINKTPCVFYSGGIDSEIILLAMIEAGYKPNHDFHCVHAVYDEFNNNDDTKFVDKFAKKFSINVEKIKLDAESWYKSSECFDYCVKNNISYVTLSQIPRLIQIMNHRNMYPIIGHGDPQIYKKDGIIYHCDFEFQNTWTKFIHNNNLYASTHFFRETGDIYTNYVYEFMNNIKEDTNYSELEFWNHSTPSIKYRLFEYFNLEKRPKFTGHENYRTDEINQINLKLQQHTKYTISNRLAKPLKDFIKDFKY